MCLKFISFSSWAPRAWIPSNGDSQSLHSLPTCGTWQHGPAQGHAAPWLWSQSPGGKGQTFSLHLLENCCYPSRTTSFPPAADWKTTTPVKTGAGYQIHPKTIPPCYCRVPRPPAWKETASPRTELGISQAVLGEHCTLGLLTSHSGTLSSLIGPGCRGQGEGKGSMCVGTPRPVFVHDPVPHLEGGP